jgi:hypothetical protein
MIARENRIPPWRDLRALGIVAKEQGPPECCGLQNRPDF